MNNTNSKDLQGQGPGTKERALNRTIDECISLGILTEILQKERDKVISSMLSEYNEQEVREVIADDAYQRGHEQREIKGNKQGERRLAKLISLLLRDGKTDEVGKVAEDEALREQYYQRYGIDKNAE